MAYISCLLVLEAVNNSEVLLAGVKKLVLCHCLLTAYHAPQAARNAQVMEVEAFCGVHDMIHAAILSYGSQASLREVMAPPLAPLTIICHHPPPPPAI